MLIIDAKAMKHIDVAHLCLQDEVNSNMLRVCRVKSEDNLADIGTKAISNKIISLHAISLGCIDAQENLKTGDDMVLWISKSEQADQSSPVQQTTSL